MKRVVVQYMEGIFVLQNGSCLYDKFLEKCPFPCEKKLDLNAKTSYVE